MKLFIKISLLLLLPVFSIAQQNSGWEKWDKEQIDSLQLIWHNGSDATDDTVRMAAARNLGLYYEESKLDSGLYFTEQEEALARKLKLKFWEGDALENKGYLLSQLKNYSGSLQSFLEGKQILEDKETEKNIWRISIFSKQADPRVTRLTSLGWIHQDIAQLYTGTGNIQDALSNFYESLKIGESIHDYTLLSVANMQLSNLYINRNKLDSALSFVQTAIQDANASGFQNNTGDMLNILGTVYFKKGNYVLAKQYFTQAIQAGQDPTNQVALAYFLLNMGKVYSIMSNRDSSLWYTKKAKEIFQSGKDPEGLDSAYVTLSSIYKLRNNMDSAFYYQSLAMAAKDSINSVEKIKQFQNIGFDQQLKVQQLEKEKIENQDKIRTYGLLAGLGVLIIIAFIIFRNNRQQHKANIVLAKTLADLKATQSQLIQSEKMASLGELTAGIAHEIQNPLNFVNNFSEVNKELIEELNAERLKPKAERNEQSENELLNDIKENEEKINHHGKRADAIVKGMLQHSQAGTGKKESTDINNLAGEYLRLAYHGFKGKDNSFNVTMKTDYDETIGNVNIIPQDIGRALLNLYNNAFYAVKPPAPKGELDDTLIKIEPTIWLKTKKEGDKILISVRDNGNGIPQKIVDKIFQPFFTTKPTGQGTGLGLSLAYDIVKAHGGEIKVETKEGEGSTFIIQLQL